jgi:hypothetical protein
MTSMTFMSNIARRRVPLQTVVYLCPAGKLWGTPCEPSEQVLISRSQVSNPILNPSLSPPCLWVDRLILLHSTILFFADALAHVGLRPRRHAVHQHFSQAPHMIRQSRRHGWRPRLPPLDRARLRNRIQLGQGQSQTRVGQHKVMIRLEDRQLLSQPGFVFYIRYSPAARSRPHAGETPG